MADSLLVVGAGGHGKVVADAVMEMARWSRIGFVDDRSEHLKQVAGVPVIGRLADLMALRGEWSAAAIAIGDARRRLEVLEIVLGLKFELPVIIHPGAIVSRLAAVGVGTVVFAQAAINAGTTIGSGCIVNTGATVDHDCQLGDGVHIAPGANLAGDVTVGDRSWVGIGSAVLQGVSIGRDVMVGAGAVVLQDVPDAVTVYGIPARVRSEVIRSRTDD